jgi:heme-degrading monooxygenase HmoA
MILEVAILDVKPGLSEQFETAFAEASTIIAGMSGYVGHELQRCLEEVRPLPPPCKVAEA